MLLFLHSLLQKTDPAMLVEGGAIRVVVEPGSTVSTKCAALELSNAKLSPSSGPASARMMSLDNISQTSSSGLDLGVEPSLSTCSNECPLEASSEGPTVPISKFPRCDSHDSGMA